MGYGVLKRFVNKFGDNMRLCQLYGRDISYSFFRIYCAALLYEHAYCTKKMIDMNVYKRFVNGNMQSSFVSGDCGKCLVSESLVNLLNNKVDDNIYGKQIKYLNELGMGKYSQ